MSGLTRTIGAAALGLWAGLAAANAPSSRGNQPEGVSVPDSAKGVFEVKVTPVTGDAKESIAAGRLTIEKKFQGDLVGTSSGEMWTVDTGVEGSGGYVAIEKVRGTLGGRRGTFALLHQGTMSRGGDFKLRIVVVPDSGTEQLEGLTGSMAIIIAEGKHSYEFDYALPDFPKKP